MGVPDPACTCVAPFRREPLKSLRLHRPTFGSLLTGRKMLTRRGLLRNGALIASGSLCAPWASSLPQTAGGDDQQTWTIGNDLVKRVLAFRPTQGAPSQVGLFTQQLSTFRWTPISSCKGRRTPVQPRNFRSCPMAA